MIGYVAQGDLAGHDVAQGPAVSRVHDGESGGNVVGGAAQLPQHPAGLVVVRGFADSLTLEDHRAVGPDDQSRIHMGGNRLGLFQGEPPHHVLGGFSGNGLLGQVGRGDREIQAQVVHQLAPAGGRRCQRQTGRRRAVG